MKENINFGYEFFYLGYDYGVWMFLLGRYLSVLIEQTSTRSQVGAFGRVFFSLNELNPEKN